jgi:hypothetical protein
MPTNVGWVDGLCQVVKSSELYHVELAIRGELVSLW